MSVLTKLDQPDPVLVEISTEVPLPPVTMSWRSPVVVVKIVQPWLFLASFSDGSVVVDESPSLYISTEESVPLLPRPPVNISLGNTNIYYHYTVYHVQ